MMTLFMQLNCFRKLFSVHEIKREEQVNADETMEIKFIKILKQFTLYIKEDKLLFYKN